MRVRATLTLRNEAAIAAREKLGMTQVELGAASGVGQQIVSRIERMHFKGIGNDRIETLASFLGLDGDVLVPPELRSQRLVAQHVLVRNVAPSALLGMSQAVLLENKDAPMEAEEAQRAIAEALDTLTFREREVVKLTYGIGDGHEHTLDELGRIFRVSPSRVAEIRNKALRKLRHPSRARKIISATSGTEDA